PQALPRQPSPPTAQNPSSGGQYTAAAASQSYLDCQSSASNGPTTPTPSAPRTARGRNLAGTQGLYIPAHSSNPHSGRVSSRQSMGLLARRPSAPWRLR